MKGQGKAIAVFMLLMLLAGPQSLIPHALAAGTPQAGATWWNDSYHFRRAVSLVNGGSTPMVNQTVILHLNFTGNDVEDPLSSVRLVNASGVEVPSVVLGAEYSGLFLRSAFLLFLANVPPQSSASYYVYYGSAFQGVPSYRGSGPAGTLGNGYATASSGPLGPGSAQFQLGFGSVETETLMSMVSYDSVSFGPPAISPQQFNNDTGLTFAGQIGPGTSVGFEDLWAGSVQLTRMVVVSAKTILTVDAVSNWGSNTVSNAALTSVVGLGGLLTFGSSNSAYDDSSGLLYTSNPVAYFGMQQSTGAASFDVGTASSVYAEATAGAFAGTSAYSKATAAGFTWDLGDIQPSSSAWISSGWSVSIGAPPGVSAFPVAPIQGSLGQQEMLNVATPKAKALWSSDFTLTNVAIPASGLAVPLGTSGATLIPGLSTVSGTYSYSVPPSGRQDPSSWSTATSSTGNATVFASPQYFAFDTGRYVELLTSNVPDTLSTASASLVTAGAFALGGTNNTFEVSYKASYAINAGNFSAQRFFISVDFDPTLTKNYTESAYLPVTGSSSTIPFNGCAPQGTTGSKVEPGQPSGFLIGDNTWRTLSIPLPADLPSTGFNVRLRMCSVSSLGFSGSMNLEVASANIVLKGPVSTVIAPTFSSTAPLATLNYLPEPNPISPASFSANLTFSLVFQRNVSIGWKDGSTFSGSIQPPSFGVNGSALNQLATLGQPRFEGLVVGSAIAQSVESATFNGTSVAEASDNGVAIIGGGGSAMISSPTSFEALLNSETATLSVLDQNGVGVQGVQILTYVEGHSIPLQLFTDGAGKVQAQLAPWAFHFVAFYQGSEVGTGDLQASAQNSLPISANIYNTVLLVKDSHGGLIVGAQLTLVGANYTITGTTGNDGRYSFEGIANSLYSLTVNVGGGTYFNGQVSATANNAVIVVSTGYVPPLTQLLIALLVAYVPIAIILGYFVTRRLKRSK